jgi:membrane protein implicated in regulation of membrane protease activity
MSNYVPQLMVSAGIAILAFEVAVLGFATFILFFLGLSLIITGALCWIGVMPDTWPVILLSNALLTLVLAGILWRPLLRMQSKTDDKKVKSDFDGLRFFASQTIDNRGEASYKYSGVQWKVKSEAPIAEGTEVEVIKADVGVFWVRPV